METEKEGKLSFLDILTPRRNNSSVGYYNTPTEVSRILLNILDVEFGLT